MKYSIAATSVTDINPDKTTGRVSEVKLKQVMKGTVEISDNLRIPGGMNIHMVYHSDVITTDK